MMSNDKPDSALMMLGEAGGLFRKSGNLQGISNVQMLRGRLMVDKGENVKAGLLLDSARQATDFPETVWQAWYHLGRMYENQGAGSKRHWKSYRNSIGVIEKIRGNLRLMNSRASISTVRGRYTTDLLICS